MQSVSIAVLRERFAIPPPEFALLPLMVVSVTVSMLEPSWYRPPPPLWPALLPLTVQPVTVILAWIAL